MDDRKNKLGETIKELFASMNDFDVAQDGCLSDEQLASYIEGNLPSDELMELEGHLAECIHCTDKVILLSDAINTYSEASKSLITEKMTKDAMDIIQPSVFSKGSPETTFQKSKDGTKTEGFWAKIASWVPQHSPAPLMVFASLFLAVMVYGIFHMQSSEELAPEIKAISPFVQFNVYKVLPTRGKTNTLVEVHNGGLMQSGDTFQINVKLQEEAYLYILLLDSSDDLLKLYPEGASLHKKLYPDVDYLIPEKSKWILDNHKGQETLFFLTSKIPLQGLDQEIKLTKNIDDLFKKFPQTNSEKLEFSHGEKID